MDNQDINSTLLSLQKKRLDTIEKQDRHIISEIKDINEYFEMFLNEKESIEHEEVFDMDDLLAIEREEGLEARKEEEKISVQSYTLRRKIADQEFESALQCLSELRRVYFHWAPYLEFAENILDDRISDKSRIIQCLKTYRAIDNETQLGYLFMFMLTKHMLKIDATQPAMFMDAMESIGIYQPNDTPRRGRSANISRLIRKNRLLSYEDWVAKGKTDLFDEFEQLFL